MGLMLMIMGGLYWSDAGAVGATAVYLLLIGFFMLVVGGLALFANFKKIWIVLFFIELFNIALFLAMYITIIIVVMMASGSSDHFFHRHHTRATCRLSWQPTQLRRCHRLRLKRGQSPRVIKHRL